MLDALKQLVGGVVVDIGVLIFCLLAGVGALMTARDASPRQQRRARQSNPDPSLLAVWQVVAVRAFYLLVGFAFLAPIVLAIVGVIPWD